MAMPALDRLVLTIGLAIALLALAALVRRRPRLPPLPLAFPLVALGIQAVAILLPAALAGSNPLGIDLTRWLQTAAVLAALYALIRLMLWGCLQVPPALGWWPPVPKILRDLLLLLTAAAATVLVLRDYAGVNLVGLITTSAVLTAVVGLAAQETLKDLFAGITLQLDPPFREGDWIDLGEAKGTVVGLTLMNTHLMGLDRARVVVPNDTVSQAVLRRYKERDPVGNRFSLGLDYGLPPAQAQQLMLAVLQKHPRVLADPAPRIWVAEYGDSAIMYDLMVWHLDATDGSRYDVRSDLLAQIWYALQRAGHSVPYPVRELRPKRPDRGTPPIEPLDPAARAALLSEHNLFSSLDVSQREHLARESRCLRFGPGETVVREGNRGDTLFQIVFGSVEVLKSDGGSSSHRVASLGPGDVFGEMTLFTDAPRSASVRTVSETLLLEVERQDLQPLLEQDPVLLERIARMVQDRQAGLDQLMQQSSLPTEVSVLQRMRQLFGVLRGG
ncbi:mechanosensitive ion channel family protein [Synechococcus sp. CS-1328]|uniref:mechanosensitive ion channel family protein n=1 Tax=Synechococcus sp. CS-1328 TaxID=2847976 RepID=UPI00223BEC45|nr:mechanosensitive ion channel family protein [Synechococcus sp. CS-1328]MCT0223674.1 mechanosensitive ion channel family protein [Synechococcus sp. CS-1328]